MGETATTVSPSYLVLTGKMKSISIILTSLLLLSCSQEKKESSNFSTDKNTDIDTISNELNLNFYKGFNENDTIIFTNPKYGNDTLFIDSLKQYEIKNANVKIPTGEQVVYGKYICGSEVRLNHNEIVNELSAFDEFGGGHIYFSQKFIDQPQSYIFRLGEFYAIPGQLDSTSTEFSLPNHKYDVVITSDTLYLEPSEFHINKVLWSYKHGPVGFVTLGEHLWYRQ
jgi:hypothetical protein